MEFFFGFIGGAVLVGFAAFRQIEAQETHLRETLKAIYWGWGAPDENGSVGWYRDNRNGSPFTSPVSPWAEAGGTGSEMPVPPYAPPPPKPKV